MAPRERRRRTEPLTAKDTRDAPKGKGRPSTALIVDDNPDVREMLRISLSLDGWAVVEATSGEEAIEQWRTSRPDIVLLDHQMSGMNGLECAAKLRELADGARIVLFTAHLDEATTEEARRLRILPMRKGDHKRLQEILTVLAEQLRESHASVS